MRPRFRKTPKKVSSRAGSAEYVLLELGQLVARLGCLLELQVLRVIQHRLLQPLDFLGQLLLTHGLHAQRIFRGLVGFLVA